MWVADLAMNVTSPLNCLNKRLSTPFPQSNIVAAAAEVFTELYNGFIVEKFVSDNAVTSYLIHYFLSLILINF